MPDPSSPMTVVSNSRPPKNAKAATAVEQDPELWRDIQSNVRKMDDLYDATFYTWLRSEDNVLVTASYLQRLAGEYDLERIEHALCWLVHGWRLESIAVLVKEVTFDWAMAKGCQGEKDRARLVLALTDNWSIQYVARLACTLLTGATSSSQPPLALQFTAGHARSVSCSGSPLSPTTPAGTAFARTSPSDSRVRATTPTSLTSQPSPVHDQMADARRMVLSRRHIPPAPAMTPEEGAYSFGRPMAAAAGLISSPASVRDARATCPSHHNALRTSALGHGTAADSRTTITAQQPLTLAAAAPIYPTSQQSIQHAQQCVNHTQPQLRYQQQQHPQHLQHQQQQQPQLTSPRFSPAAHTPHSQSPQHTRLHSRQQSQPDNTSASKLQWQQQSWASAIPTFYMDKDVFMEELSKKWSFCRLSEFFQCVDLASGISHRFKCALLKESALKEEQTRAKKRLQLQQQAARTAGSTLSKPLSFQPSIHPLSVNTADVAKSVGATTASIIQGSTLGRRTEEASPTLSARIVVNRAEQSSMGDYTKACETLPMEQVQVSHQGQGQGQSSTPALNSTSVQDKFSKDVAHSLADESMEESGASSERDSAIAYQSNSQPLGSTASTPSPSPPPHTQLNSGIRYHPVQGYTHGNYSDDMNSILSRGWGSAEGGHSRSQTVDAIMSNPSLSPSSSAVSSPISTSSASASLSTLTLADTGRETSLPRQSSQQFLNHHHQEQHQQQQQQQQQALSNYGAASFGSQGLFRNGPASATASSTASSASASSDLGPLSSGGTPLSTSSSSLSLSSSHNSLGHPHRQPNDSSSAKRKNSLGVGSLPSSNHCSGFGPSSTAANGLHGTDGSSLSSSSSIFPGPRRTSTSASTSNEDLKRVRCSRQSSTTSTTSGR